MAGTALPNHVLGIEGIDPRVYLRRLRDPLHGNSLLLILNTLVPSFWGVVFWLIVARVYHPRDVGVATAIFPTAGLIASLATLGFTISLVRFLPAEGPRAREVINSSLTLSVCLAFLGALLTIPLAESWSSDLAILRLNPFFGASFVIFAVASTGSSLVDSALIAKGRTGYVFVKNNVAGAGRIPLPLVFASLGVAGSLAIFSSFTLSFMVALGLGLLYFVPRAYLGYRARPRLDANRLMPMMRFSLANHGAAIAALLPGALIPLMVLRWRSPEESAYYYSGWIAAGVLFSVSASTSTSLLAEGSKSEATMARNTRRAWAFILALQVPAVIAAFFLARPILDFFQEGYSAAAPMFQLMVLASFFVAFTNVYLARKRVERHNAAIVLVAFLSSALYLALALPLIQAWGLTGVGAAFLVAQGLTAAAIAVSHLVHGADTVRSLIGAAAEEVSNVSEPR